MRVWIAPETLPKHLHIALAALATVHIGKSMESQQPAVTRQRPLNNRWMVIAVRSVLEHATVEYVIPTLSKTCTATEEQCFLRGSRREVISVAVSPCGGLNLEVVKLTTVEVTNQPLQHKICKIGMFCSAKPVLTEDLCVEQR
jgi:hypothetical protein